MAYSSSLMTPASRSSTSPWRKWSARSWRLRASPMRRSTSAVRSASTLARLDSTKAAVSTLASISLPAAHCTASATTASFTMCDEQALESRLWLEHTR